MSAPPDDDLADDDLDATAKLPILSGVDSVDAPPDLDDATGEYRTQLGVAAALRVEAGEHLDLMDELVSVRDRIVSLETALADTETRLTQLHASHDSLQSDHSDLLIHSQAVSRDRDRLAEESLLWLASRQQLQDCSGTVELGAARRAGGCHGRDEGEVCGAASRGGGAWMSFHEKAQRVMRVLVDRRVRRASMRTLDEPGLACGSVLAGVRPVRALPSMRRPARGRGAPVGPGQTAQSPGLGG